MKKWISSITALILIIVASINNPCNASRNLKSVNDSLAIAQLLDSFNIAAAQANFDVYFNFFAEDAIFIGTDATERWNKGNFMIWAKPFFLKKKTWNFQAVERHIYLDKTGNMAWFDELLSTQMKICRGSGMLEKIDNQWKIKQYVLSMTIPNELVDEVVKRKTPIEDSMLETFLKKK